jgi:HD-GYP domain-containing protein (c-di-GMP phosphodiesterase class II)
MSLSVRFLEVPIMSRSADLYRKITPDFIRKTCTPEFKIYTRSVDGTALERFIHDSTFSSAMRQETLDMLIVDLDKDFFIHEDTLIQHYRDLIKVLQGNMGKLGGGQKQLKAIYLLAEEVMREYLERIDSAKILRVQEDIVNILDQFIIENKLTFTDIFKITNKDQNVHTHCVNVGLYSWSLGIAFQLDATSRRDLFLGGMFSDIGKKFIPDKIKIKKEKLTPDEFKEVRKHPATSKMVLNHMKHFSESVLQMVEQHHERFNAKGYPRGLSGEHITLQARIGALMDVFAALTSDRTYRNRLSPLEVFSIMKKEMAGSFDERVFANFIKMIASPHQDSPTGQLTRA